MLEEVVGLLMRKADILKVRVNKGEGELSSTGQESHMWVISLLLKRILGRGCVFLGTRSERVTRPPKLQTGREAGSQLTRV